MGSGKKKVIFVLGWTAHGGVDNSWWGWTVHGGVNSSREEDGS